MNIRKKPSNLEEKTPDFPSLLPEILLHILSYLSEKDLITLSQVSKYFNTITDKPILASTANHLLHYTKTTANSSLFNQLQLYNCRELFFRQKNNYYLIIGANEYYHLSSNDPLCTLTNLYNKNLFSSPFFLFISSHFTSTLNTFYTLNTKLQSELSPENRYHYFIFELPLSPYQAMKIKKFMEGDLFFDMAILSNAIKQTEAVYYLHDTDKLLKKEIVFENENFVEKQDSFNTTNLVKIKNASGKEFVKLGERKNFRKP